MKKQISKAYYRLNNKLAIKKRRGNRRHSFLCKFSLSWDVNYRFLVIITCHLRKHAIKTHYLWGHAMIKQM